MPEASLIVAEIRRHLHAPPVTERLITLAEVAEMLGVSRARLYRQRRVLREHGFPAPVPGMGRLYDPQAIRDWLARQRGPQGTAPAAIVPPPVSAAPTPEEIAAWQAELDRRALGLARPRGSA